MLNELIGSRLVEIDDCGFTVIDPKNRKRHFEFNEDYGDCCGYNEIATNLFISKEELANNPIITEVCDGVPVSMKSRFDDVDDCYCCDTLEITFMGEYKPLAEISSKSGSGSGWQYGAHAWVTCVETGEEQELTSW